MSAGSAWLGRPGTMLAACVAVPLAAIGMALISQYGYDLQPCPWCVLQRVIFAAIALVAVVGLLWRSTLGRRGVALGILLLGGGGMVAALWQHFVAAASASCALTVADRIVTALQLNAWLPDLFEARASCADAAVKLAGIPYEFYSLALFVLLAAAALRLFVHPR